MGVGIDNRLNSWKRSLQNPHSSRDPPTIPERWSANFWIYPAKGIPTFWWNSRRCRAALNWLCQDCLSPTSGSLLGLWSFPPTRPSWPRLPWCRLSLLTELVCWIKKIEIMTRWRRRHKSHTLEQPVAPSASSSHFGEVKPLGRFDGRQFQEVQSQD